MTPAAVLTAAHPAAASPLVSLADGGLLQHCSDCVSACATGNALLFSFTALSVFLTARFLLSYHPGLEAAAVEERRLPWSTLTLLDPVLQPVRRHYFRQAGRRGRV